MPTRFNLPHIDIADRRIIRPYQAPRENRGGGGARPIREEHGARLKAQLAASFQAADLVRPADDRLPEPPQGVYLEVELKRSAKPDNLEKKRSGIKPGAVQLEEDEKTTVALYVPDDGNRGRICGVGMELRVRLERVDAAGLAGLGRWARAERRDGDQGSPRTRA